MNPPLLTHQESTWIQGGLQSTRKSVDLVEKNSQILIEYSLKSKESKKKMVCNSELERGRNDQNKTKCSKFVWVSVICPNELVKPVKEKSQILTEYSLKSKESKNKTMHNSEPRWGRND